MSEGIYTHADNVILQPDDKIYLDDLQQDKMLLSDIIYVVNKDNYVGTITKHLIEQAKKHNKEIKYVYSTDETNEN